VRSRLGPLIAGAVALALAILLILLLVLPKMHSVSDAKTHLATAASQQSILNAQLSALQQAEAASARDKAVIANVQRQLPPTADEPGMLLLMSNAATQAGIKLWLFTPSTPTVVTGESLSSIPVSFTVKGSYFALAEFLYNVQTLPRVAKVQNVALSAASTTTGTTSSVPFLSMTGSVTFYTTDTSAGPGSQPGPTSGTSSTAPQGT
jgi:Tfp pilus assembly protein PilO